MDHLPLPSLQLYTLFSSAGLLYAVVYSLMKPEDVVVSLWSDVVCATALVNFLCCVYLQLMSRLHVMIFGSLRNPEKRNLQDNFWNFIFYKFIFIFGVMNIQDIKEILMWCAWFALIGCLLLTSQLYKDRFLYLSFSPTISSSSHAKMIVFLSGLLVSCAGLFMVCAIVGWQYGFNYFVFLFSEIYVLFALTLQTLIRHIIHLWDMHHEGLWENRNVYTYYAEFVLEISSLSVQLLHHFHMLIWANMFLSVASLILLMKLRFLYQEIQNKMKHHQNYIFVKQTLEKSLPVVGPGDFPFSRETCAVCWEKLSFARELPCKHKFHFGCLRSWLQKDPVCPTCRQPLGDLLRKKSFGSSAMSNTRNRRNWLLYFNGASIATWLPSFSLELHQPPPVNDFHHHIMNEEVDEAHSMFPNVPVNTIILDLENTQSVNPTVNNILSGNVQEYLPSPVTIDCKKPISGKTDWLTTINSLSSLEARKQYLLSRARLKYLERNLKEE